MSYVRTAADFRAFAAGQRWAIEALRKEAADFAYEEGQDHRFRLAANFLENRAAAEQTPATELP